MDMAQVLNKWVEYIQRPSFDKKNADAEISSFMKKFSINGRDVRDMLETAFLASCVE